MQYLGQIHKKNRERRGRAMLACLAVSLAALAAPASEADAMEATIVCAVRGTALTIPETQIFFDSTARRCEISDVGPVSGAGLRAFVLPGFGTPTILGQKINGEGASPPESFTTSWTNSAPSNGPNAAGFESSDPGSHSATLTGSVDGTTFTMNLAFTVTSSRDMTVDSASVSYTPADRSLVTGSLGHFTAPGLAE